MKVKIKFVILVATAVLLVPFVYATSYVPEVCAESKDPKWGKTGECWNVENNTAQMCCWEVPDPKDPKKTIEKCQMCANDGPADSNQCGPVVIIPKSPQTGPTSSPQGGILETPPTKSPKTFGNLGGEVLQVQPPANDTTTNSEGNISSNDSSTPEDANEDNE